VLVDLVVLKDELGITSTQNDASLSRALEAASDWVESRVYPESVRAPEVRQAVLLLASRLYKRRNSPDGVAGWDDGGAVRILRVDPDVERLITHHMRVSYTLGLA
jgi:Phage gp6-like head-tail connector protein